MSSALVGLGLICISLAGLVHVMIFVLESVRWSQPEVWKRFGVASQADADLVQPMAYNQGFYNLFLAIGAIGGVLLFVMQDADAVGATLALFAAGSMLAAALVLVLSNGSMARAASIQGVMPAIGVVSLATGMLVG